jgi:hypothetical protein
MVTLETVIMVVVAVDKVVGVDLDGAMDAHL